MHPSSDVIKVSLNKTKKKDDLGIVLGCKIYIKEISNKCLKEGSLQEGDVLLKINSSSLDNMTLKEAKKLIESCKDKIQLTVKRQSNLINNNSLTNNSNINRHFGNLSGDSTRYSIYENGSAHLANRNAMKEVTLLNPSFGQGNLWSTANQNVYVPPPTRSGQQVTGNLGQTPLMPANSQMQPNLSYQQHSLTQQQPPPPSNQAPTSGGNLSRHPSSTGVLANRVNRPPPLEMPAYLPPPPPPPPLHIIPDINSGDPELPTPPPPSRPSLPQYGNTEDVTPVKVSRSRRSSVNAITTEPRVISFKKEGSVGIRLTGGNEVGIFVTGVQPGSPAAVQGLQPGDKILKVNRTDLKGFTREDAVMYFLSVQDQVDLLVQHKKGEYESIVSSQKGDSFHVRTHFDFNSSTKGELSFHCNEVFHVTDTLYNGAVGSWSVHRLGRNNQDIQKGTIPNQSRAEQLASDQTAEKIKRAEASEGRGSFFRRRSARRSKSFSRDHHRWLNGVSSLDGLLSNKFPAYERVSLKHPGFIRPLVIFGPLADIAREKLMKEYPDKYAIPQIEPNGEPEGESTSKSSPSKTCQVFRLSSIREIIDKGKHPLLDITPQAVERLNYAQFYPIVIFMRAENKTIVKELRARHTKISGLTTTSYSSTASSASNTRQKSSRKLFERNVKLEKHWSHVFTSTIALTGADMWYKKLRETIERQQQQNIWIAVNKPDEIISDDFLFPMNSRMSYASSPESDLDMTLDSCKDDDDEDDRKDSKEFSKGSRLVKACSDPSIAKLDMEDDGPSTSGVSSSHHHRHHRQVSRACHCLVVSVLCHAFCFTICTDDHAFCSLSTFTRICFRLPCILSGLSART